VRSDELVRVGIAQPKQPPFASGSPGTGAMHWFVAVLQVVPVAQCELDVHRSRQRPSEQPNGKHSVRVPSGLTTFVPSQAPGVAATHALPWQTKPEAQSAVAVHDFLQEVVAASHEYGEQLCVVPESEHDPEPLQRRDETRLLPEQVVPVPHGVDELG